MAYKCISKFAVDDKNYCEPGESVPELAPERAKQLVSAGCLLEVAEEVKSEEPKSEEGQESEESEEVDESESSDGEPKKKKGKK